MARAHTRRARGIAESLDELTREQEAKFTKIIDWDNTKLQEELLPAYRQMLDLFRENYWLAKPETRDHYPTLVEFVEVWNRWLDDALPREVLERLEHSKKNSSRSMITSPRRTTNCAVESKAACQSSPKREMRHFVVPVLLPLALAVLGVWIAFYFRPAAPLGYGLIGSALGIGASFGLEQLKRHHDDLTPNLVRTEAGTCRMRT